MNPIMPWGLLIFWIVGSAAALAYAQIRGIPNDIALRVLPAFLLEATMFLSLGIDRTRARLEKLPVWGVAALLTIASVLPYAAAALATHSFDLRSAGVIAGLAAVASLWYVILPHRAATDLLFLAFVGVVAFSKILQAQYVDPHPRLAIGILGQLMWIRTAAFSLLSVRRVQGVGFGFWPDRQHWKIGALYYLALLPAAALVAWAVKFGGPHVPAAGWERVTVLAVGNFFGILWVVALGEEFFFRGLLQQWTASWLGNEWLGLLITSVLFGVVHLWLRAFPDWQFAALAATAGVFYGLAFRQAKSIRASMVTHALTVTTWRVFFS
jgi:membrane protease YdiL (CAAX protease family)